MTFEWHGHVHQGPGITVTDKDDGSVEVNIQHFLNEKIQGSLWHFLLQSMVEDRVLHGGEDRVELLHHLVLSYSLDLEYNYTDVFWADTTYSAEAAKEYYNWTCVYRDSDSTEEHRETARNRLSILKTLVVESDTVSDAWMAYCKTFDLVPDGVVSPIPKLRAKIATGKKR